MVLWEKRLAGRGTRGESRVLEPGLSHSKKNCWLWWLITGCLRLAPAINRLFIICSDHFPALPGIWTRHRMSVQKRVQAPVWKDGETQAEKGRD